MLRNKVASKAYKVGIKMKTGRCTCGNRLFFGNSVCLACGREVGRCDTCHEIASRSPNPGGTPATCGQCGVHVHPCINRTRGVCNAWVESDGALCHWCAFTSVAPNLEKPENLARWAELERAKRRLLLQLEYLGFPPYLEDTAQTHPLSFRLMENEVDAQGQVIPVYTGHANGVITVNVIEADSVHRERTRVAMHEPQRTLIGHMRHEVGHYIDWAWASRYYKSQYVELFGDPDAVDYEACKQRHYSEGPSRDWATQHVSAYASMHPWEDFAETVNAYLDLMAIGVTAIDQGMGNYDLSPATSAEELIPAILQIAVAVSEFNLDLGLSPLLPERFTPPVMRKLNFVHSLRQSKSTRMVQPSILERAG